MFPTEGQMNPYPSFSGTGGWGSGIAATEQSDVVLLVPTRYHALRPFWYRAVRGIERALEH